MNNLASNPEYAGKIEELTALMKKSQAQYDDVAPLTVANPKPAKWDPSMATKWKPIDLSSVGIILVKHGY